MAASKTNIDEVTDAKRVAAERENQIAEQAQATLKRMVDEGRIEAPATVEKGRYVAYSAPVEKNTRFLVRPGRVVAFADKDSPFGQKQTHREGDLFLEFQDGLVVLDTENADDQERISFCRAHPELCRDVTDPMTEAWVVLKEGQQPLAWRDPVIPQSLNVDNALRGDPSGFARPGSSIEKAREHLADANR